MEPWVQPLIATGPYGVVLAMIVFGWLYAKPTVDDLKKINKRYEVQDDEQRLFLRNVTMPAISASTEAAEKTAVAISALQAEVRHLGDQVTRLTGELERQGRRRPAT